MSVIVCVGFLIQVLTILPGHPLLLVLMFLLFCSVFINFFSLPSHKKPALSYTALLSVWFILIHINTYFSGGVKNSGNFYLATFILTAFILLGSRGGKVAAALSVMHVLYFYFITTYTHRVSYALVGEGDALLNVYFLLSTSVSLLLLAGGSNYIEKSKNAVFENLLLKNEQLTDASGRLQLSTRAGKIGIWDWDIVNNIITWDGTMFSLHGVTNSFTVSYSNWESMLHPDDKLELHRQLDLAISGEAEYETEYKISWPDKTTRYIKAAAQVHRDSNGEPLRILGANWDITESRKAEEAIVNSNKRYELATKATSNAIWDWDILTGEMFWSEAYHLSFGYNTPALKERFGDHAARIHKEDYPGVYEGLTAVLSGENGDYWEDEYRFLKADGTYAHVYDRGYLVFDEENKPVRFVGAMQDITARKGVEMERELIIQELIQSNADLKQFSFITSHNLRAPLSNISATLDLIDRTTLNTYNNEMLDMLKSSGKQLVKTIDDLTNILLIKNNRNAEITRLDLNDTLFEIKKAFSASLAEAGGTMYTNIRIPYLRFHKVYLESMFINLVSNAIKYRSLNRRLVISIDSYIDVNDDCIIAFSDNGTGIDLKRYKDRIFGLYQRFHDKSEGQGLGLFIIKSQIEALGGKITVESEVDRGTTFTITLKKQFYKNETLAVESAYSEMI